MQLVPTAFLAALLAAAAQAEVQFNYLSDVPYSRKLAIVTANGQLQLLKDNFKDNEDVYPLLSAGIKTFKASVEDGTFTWSGYMDEYDAFLKELSIDDQKAVREALDSIEAYTPWDWRKDYVEYSWDCITRSLEEGYNFYVEQGVMTDEIEEKINEFQSPILRIEPAQYLAGDRVLNFLNDLLIIDQGFSLEAQSASATHIAEMEKTRKEYEDPLATTEPPAPTATETTTPTTTTATPVANNVTKPQPTNATAPTPSETKSAAPLASISMAIATVAVSVAAIFA